MDIKIKLIRFFLSKNILVVGWATKYTSNVYSCIMLSVLGIVSRSTVTLTMMKRLLKMNA